MNQCTEETYVSCTSCQIGPSLPNGVLDGPGPKHVRQKLGTRPGVAWLQAQGRPEGPGPTPRADTQGPGTGPRAQGTRGARVNTSAVRHSIRVYCVTQQTCVLCDTADMSTMSHDRHVCYVTQQTCVLRNTADMSTMSHSRHVCYVTHQTCPPACDTKL